MYKVAFIDKAYLSELIYLQHSKIDWDTQISLSLSSLLSLSLSLSIYLCIYLCFYENTS